MSGTDPNGGRFQKGDPTKAFPPGAGQTPPQEGLPKIPGITLHHEIARGGMGVVYAGRQDFLDRRVAVKFLSVELGGASFAQRFQREAKILAGIKHPNIVACHTADTTEAGQSYLVMEFIDGPSLKGWVQENGPVAPLASLRLVRAVAQALAHAHQSEVIHRDVKPENILLESVTSTAIDIAFPFTPKLVDLGLARMTHEQAGMGLTSPGSVMGTPSTMSPEQFDDPDSVDFRSDIYGLGCVLYEMLVGQPAFRGNKLTEIVIRKRSPVPPNPCEERPELPAALGAFVQRMLASNREDRPSSYKQLDEEIVHLTNALLASAGRTDTIVSVRPDEAGATIVSVRPGAPSEPSGERTVPSAPRTDSKPAQTPSAKGGSAPPSGPGLLRTAELDFLREMGAAEQSDGAPQFRESASPTGVTVPGGGGATGEAVPVAARPGGNGPRIAFGAVAVVAAGVGVWFGTRGGGDDAGGGGGAAGNLPPVIAAIEGPTAPVPLGEQFRLRVEASDPENDALEYEWVFPDSIVAKTTTSRPEVTFQLDDGLEGVELAIEARVFDRLHGGKPTTQLHRVVVGECAAVDPTVGMNLPSSPWKLDTTDRRVWTQTVTPDGDSFVSCKARGQVRTCTTRLGDERYWEWFGSLRSDEDDDDLGFAKLGVRLEFADRAFGVRCTRDDEGEAWHVEIVECMGQTNDVWECRSLQPPCAIDFRQPEDTVDEYRGWFSLKRIDDQLVLQIGETRLTSDGGTREEAPRLQPPITMPLPKGANEGRITLVVEKGIGRFRIKKR